MLLYYHLFIQLLDRQPYRRQNVLPGPVCFVVGRLYRAGRGEAQEQIPGPRQMSQEPLMSSPPPEPQPGFDLPRKL